MKYIMIAMMLCAGCAAADKIAYIETEEVGFDLYREYDGLRRPWGMDELPDGSLLITERGGGLVYYSEGEAVAIADAPEVAAIGQGGMLDVAVAPDFDDNGLIFVSYSQPVGRGARTAVARGRLNLARQRLDDVDIIFESKSASTSEIHFGSRLAFLQDGTLLVTIGDRGSRQSAQDMSNHAGAVIRIDENGDAPDDNPFAQRDDALPELFSIGHRNAQGLFVDDAGNIWLNEHGPRGGDEINIVEGGINYGWPTVSFGREYSNNAPIGLGVSAPGLRDPLLEWTPSIAPSGMMRYAGDMFAEWRGDLFIGALAGRHIRRVRVRDGRAQEQEVILDRRIGRVRDIMEAKDGSIYVITDKSFGELYRLAR